jgi:CBS domain-containing protein
MLRVRDIMTRDPIVVEREATLREVADLLSNKGISGVPVVSESGVVVGVVSASDILSFTANTPGVPADRSERFRQWGDDDEEPVDDEESDSEFFFEMWSESEAELVERIRDTTSPEWDALSEHTVAEVMTRRLQSMSPDADLATAAALMVSAKVHRLLVIDKDDHLVGLISASDFVRAVAEAKLR